MLCDKVVPFQELFYYNCFHSALFAVVEANNGDYRRFIVNGIPHLVLQYQGQDSRLLYRFSFIEDYSKLLLENGLECVVMQEGESIIDFTRNALQNGMPVILNVDGYGLPYRKDLYHQQYWPHSLLVVGYNKLTDTFRIVDQPSLDNVAFRFYSIDRCSLQTASDIFVKRKKEDLLYSSEANLAFYSTHIPKRDKTILKDIWRKNFMHERTIIETGIYDAYGQAQHFTNILLHISEMETSGNYFLEGLNDIVKQKKWETAIMKQLGFLSDEDAAVHFSLWSRTRDLAGLVVLSGRPRSKTADNFHSTYLRAIKSEVELINRMLKE